MAKKVKPEVDDFQDKMCAYLKARMPTGGEDDDGKNRGTVEINLSDEEIISDIKYVLTTGIAAFDDIVGGMPFGRIVELYGLEGCGKTALSIRSAVRAQLKKIKRVRYPVDSSAPIEYEDLDPAKVRVSVVYIDNESSLSESKIYVDGVKLKCIVMRTDTIDQVFKKVSESIRMMEQQDDENGIIRFLVVIIDTIASTSSREELNAAWDKRDFPRLPGEISRGFSKLVRRINRSNVCLICTNQVRTAFKASSGAPQLGNAESAWSYSSAGGLALRFYASHRVFMQKLGNRYKFKPTDPFSSGIKIGFCTVKNRHNVPERDGKMVLRYTGKNSGLDDVYSMLETLVQLKFIEIGAKEKAVNFTVKFAKSGVVTKTFDVRDVSRTLDEEDEMPAEKRKRKKDPTFKYRADWPAFYKEHQEDVDALWGVAMAYVAGKTHNVDEALDEEALAEEIFGEDD